MTNAASIVREMTPWEAFWHRAYLAAARLSRRLPRLVWYNDEVDVTIELLTADGCKVVDTSEIIR